MSMAFSKERFETPCGEGEQSCVLCRRFPSFCLIDGNENAFEIAERAELLKRLEDETISEDKKMLIKKALGMEHFANGNKMVTDNVNSPAHYTQGGIECIDCIKAALGDNFIGFLTGNVMKYVYRYKNKNGVEDLKKAAVYLNWAIKELSENDER